MFQSIFPQGQGIARLFGSDSGVIGSYGAQTCSYSVSDGGTFTIDASSGAPVISTVSDAVLSNSATFGSRTVRDYLSGKSYSSSNYCDLPNGGIIGGSTQTFTLVSSDYSQTIGDGSPTGLYEMFPLIWAGCAAALFIVFATFAYMKVKKLFAMVADDDDDDPIVTYIDSRGRERWRARYPYGRF